MRDLETLTPGGTGRQPASRRPPGDPAHPANSLPPPPESSAFRGLDWRQRAIALDSAYTREDALSPASRGRRPGLWVDGALKRHGSSGHLFTRRAALLAHEPWIEHVYDSGVRCHIHRGSTDRQPSEPGSRSCDSPTTLSYKVRPHWRPDLPKVVRRADAHIEER
jgi:hypothetical protein